MINHESKSVFYYSGNNICNLFLSVSLQNRKAGNSSRHTNPGYEQEVLDNNKRRERLETKTPEKINQ